MLQRIVSIVQHMVGHTRCHESNIPCAKIDESLDIVLHCIPSNQLTDIGIEGACADEYKCDRPVLA